MRWNSKIRFSAILAGTIVACMHVSSIEAAPPDPVFWTWQVPGSADALAHPNIIQTVKRYASVGNPVGTANNVADDIRDRGLTSDEICIILQGFGMGHGDPLDGPTYAASPLFRHWCDSLVHPTQLAEPCELTGATSVTHWWMTPWMSNGVSASGDWMQQFIDQYELRQSTSLLPDPIRFYFDSERMVVPQFYGPGSLVAFDYARFNDLRWGSEIIKGYTSTLSSLFTHAPPGVDDYTPGLGWKHGDNQAWSKWYMSLAITSGDAALGEAAYKKIRSAWSGVAKSSNYQSSSRVDGLGLPPRLITNRHGQGATWFKYAFKGSGDLQAPVLYPAHVAHYNPAIDASHEQASVRVLRGNIESMVNSFGGGHEDEITPWIAVSGQKWMEVDKNGNCTGPDTDYHHVTKDYTRRILTMLRGKNINEFGAWCGHPDQSCEAPVADDWDDFADVIDQVWDSDLSSFTVDVGLLQAGDIDSLRYSHSDFLEVDTTPFSFSNPRIEITTISQVGFDTATIDKLRLNVENIVENTLDDVELTVLLFDVTTSQFVRVGAIETLDPYTRTHIEIEESGASDFIDAVGRVIMKLEYESTTLSGFSALVDIVQLIEADD